MRPHLCVRVCVCVGVFVCVCVFVHPCSPHRTENPVRKNVECLAALVKQTTASTQPLPRDTDLRSHDVHGLSSTTKSSTRLTLLEQPYGSCTVLGRKAKGLITSLYLLQVTHTHTHSMCVCAAVFYK